MEYVLSDRKLLPYGMMNFEDIRLDNYYYVDKTAFIPLIEQSDRFFFFIRPRRFGKSLTLNMLQHYYDIRTKDKFDALFGDLYIGKHPTKDRNSYLVIKLNFSGISGDLHSYRKGLDEHCKIVFDYFCDVYADYLPEGIKEKMNEKDGAVSQFEYLFMECARVNQKIYLFIDEYDHFTNTILSDVDSMNRYTDETHKEGYLRAFFNKIKSGTDSSIKRCFITGVSPVTMDDLTSGFNIGTNYSLSSEFNEMMGFTESEVREMLTYYSNTRHFNHTIDELIEIMKPWYDNYCFSRESLHEPMYNSDMVLYFLNHYLPLKKVPENMIDNNIRTDYNKLRHLIRLDKKMGMNASIIQDIVTNGETIGTIKTAFPAEDLAKPDNFKSLLYYFGLLTIRGTKWGSTLLAIPNLTVREQLYSYLVEAYRSADLFSLEMDRLGMLVASMAYEGNWKPVFEYFASELKRQSSIREFIEGEAHVKGFLLAYLGLTRTYIIHPEYEANKGYADFYMMPDLLHQPEIVYSYIVEVKYARRDASAPEIESLRTEAAGQLKRYAEDPKVRETKGNTKLRLITLIFKGWDLVACD